MTETVYGNEYSDPKAWYDMYLSKFSNDPNMKPHYHADDDFAGSSEKDENDVTFRKRNDNVYYSRVNEAYVTYNSQGPPTHYTDSELNYNTERNYNSYDYVLPDDYGRPPRFNVLEEFGEDADKPDEDYGSENEVSYYDYYPDDTETAYGLEDDTTEQPADGDGDFNNDDTYYGYNSPPPEPPQPEPYNNYVPQNWYQQAESHLASHHFPYGYGWPYFFPWYYGHQPPAPDAGGYEKPEEPAPPKIHYQPPEKSHDPPEKSHPPPPEPKKSYPPPKKSHPQPPPKKSHPPPPKKSHPPPPKKSHPPPKKSHPPPPKKSHPPPPKKSHPPPPPKKSHPPPKKSYTPPKKSHPPPKKSYEPPPKKTYEPPKKSHPPPKKSYQPPKKSHEPPKKSHYEPPKKSHEPAPKKSYQPPPKKSYNPAPKGKYQPPAKTGPQKSVASSKVYQPEQEAPTRDENTAYSLGGNLQVVGNTLIPIGDEYPDDVNNYIEV